MSRKISQERLIKDMRRVLENPFWIPDLESKTVYSRLHDDHDGNYTGELGVIFSEDTDAWVYTRSTSHGEALRFRTTELGGGGMSSRVRNALIILAYAIKLDNEERPIERPPQNS